MRITAHLDTSVVGLEEHPTMLDGPLSWAWAMRARAHGQPIEPITPTHAPDFPLPLRRWELGGTWGWQVSCAHYAEPLHTSTDIRRKPATQAMTFLTHDAKVHLGLGPRKARNVIRSAAITDQIWWDAEVTDVDDLADLLRLVTHIGARHNAGHGHVTAWTIEHRDGGWDDRPFPPQEAARAPYWHYTRRTSC
ncbi:hypothetical protein V7G09_04820 [Cutibacterium avidum]|uniref:hypothetical protein n=1 Tax=Cutibacterium avidum TaxID=33010 RepID=UPI00209638E6|nr:hypothetical protein [Cutibacterium avidum]MDU5809325.1 hypothetical protein [Finegoldia magna]MCO6684750.1 hypothetical protein [Cutibacterium avidum]MCO6688315.1 hypothetical protein [Cutibacterium avidum]MDU5841453.1 hypothetical protein [Cutibacterium avidum]MDU7429462.1 hypothetical protein [Cutibacterium avidum]